MLTGRSSKTQQHKRGSIDYQNAGTSVNKYKIEENNIDIVDQLQNQKRQQK